MKRCVYIALMAGWCLVAWAETGTNEVKKAVKPTAEKEQPEAKAEEPEKPRPSFKPKERIPVDQGVDFPVDI